jgi:hypothetical protein
MGVLLGKRSLVPTVVQLKLRMSKSLTAKYTPEDLAKLTPQELSRLAINGKL